MVYALITKEALEDLLYLDEHTTISSVEMEGENVRINFSETSLFNTTGRVALRVIKDVKPGKFDVKYHTEIYRPKEN